MAIEETYKRSEIEKRLKLLRNQVYGKSRYQVSKTLEQGNSGTSKTTSSISGEISYVYKDLMKVLIYSTIAIGVQIVLYIAIQQNVVKLPLV